MAKHNEATNEIVNAYVEELVSNITTAVLESCTLGAEVQHNLLETEEIQSRIHRLAAFVASRLLKINSFSDDEDEGELDDYEEYAEEEEF